MARLLEKSYAIFCSIFVQVYGKVNQGAIERGGDFPSFLRF
jgi:hypothetical protein